MALIITIVGQRMNLELVNTEQSFDCLIFLCLLAIRDC